MPLVCLDDDGLEQTYAPARAAVSVVLAASVALPFLTVVGGSFLVQGEYSFDNYREIFASAFYVNAFQTSISLSLATSVIGLIFSLPIAAALRRRSLGMQRTVLASVNIGANFVGVPLAYAFIILFGFNGAITLILKHYGLVSDLNVYSLGGLVCVYSYFQIALAVLLIFPALSAITPDLDEAARLMGISRPRFWWRIGLPILRRSLIAVFILLFANAMGTYATTYALVGGSANLVTIRIGELVAGDVFSDPKSCQRFSSPPDRYPARADPGRPSANRQGDATCVTPRRRASGLHSSASWR